MKSVNSKNLKIIDIAYDGRAVAKEDGMVYFIEKAVPGDIVDIHVTKKKKNFIEGRVIEIIEKSPFRITPNCQHFGFCGGCKWQHFDYSKQLEYKQKQVIDVFHHLGKMENIQVLPILSADPQFYYRNKLDFSFSDSRWLTPNELQDKSISKKNAVGFHLPGMFDKVLDIEHCYLQSDPSNEIRLKLKDYCKENEIEFYNSRNHTGEIRSLILRNNRENQFMINVVFALTQPEKIEKAMQYLVESFGSHHAYFYTINTKKNDSIHDLEPIHYHGPSYLTEKIGEYTFQFGPKSFFQTNSKQTELLYSVIKDFAKLEGHETVYDLYSGTGTIALYLSRLAKTVLGIEFVEEAVKDAYINAELNQVNNCTFIAGDMSKVFDQQVILQYGKPEVIVCDPPRSGIQKEVINRLLEIQAPRIVYVSCNPATQARDIELLSSLYHHVKSQPVDMFPQTHHVEIVALLELKKLNEYV
ncbi:MAG TPA: 23S rRNA (uracil(1939)-C(5))-methyltransferase RlmD [Bacteroidia bacterium]|nr:23S rRNA (uracil(1939)-C(5))-methyltransferase RlmD [Bacteroidia bacterium]